MGLTVDELSYVQAIKSIREIVLDTNPVQAFEVHGQDFLFEKTNTNIALDDETYTFTEVEKLYELMDKLREKGVNINILPNYVATSRSKDLVNFRHPDITDKKVIMMSRYFSEYDIEKLIEEHYSQYLSYSGVPRTTDYIFNNLDYFDRRKMVFWVAYHLIDRKRMNYASSAEMIRLASGGDATDLKNMETSVTTRVGDVFTVTEKDSDNGEGMDGFTSLWGDQYSYLTKLQLWIRDRFEKQFKDYSLRDNVAISQTFTMEKEWENYAWVNTQRMSDFTVDILQQTER